MKASQKKYFVIESDTKGTVCQTNMNDDELMLAILEGLCKSPAFAFAVADAVVKHKALKVAVKSHIK